MKFLKKTSSAAVICLLLVLSSTFISVNSKLGTKCREVTELFYTGLSYNNEFHAPIYEQLRGICSVANDVCIIAANYGIDTEALKDSAEWTESALAYSHDDIGYIYYEYSDLRTELKTVIDQLSHNTLSEKHEKLIEDYEAQVKIYEYNIDTAGYNESVRAFLQEYDRMPTSFIAELCGVHMPEYFA